MDLGDILSNAQIIPDLRATNRWEAIDELITNLVTTTKIKPEHRDAIAAVVKKRETSMSTGIGFRTAISSRIDKTNDASAKSNPTQDTKIITPHSRL